MFTAASLFTSPQRPSSVVVVLVDVLLDVVLLDVLVDELVLDVVLVELVLDVLLEVVFEVVVLDEVVLELVLEDVLLEVLVDVVVLELVVMELELVEVEVVDVVLLLVLLDVLLDVLVDVLLDVLVDVLDVLVDVGVVEVVLVVVVPGPVEVVVGGEAGFSSYAPTSQSALPLESPSSTRGNPAPRWSVVSVPGQLPPTSIAGLPGKMACVSVGPPLFWSGVRSGFLFTWSPAPEKPQVLALSRFAPSDVSDPEPLQLPPDVAFATSVLPIVVSPGMKRFPPRLAPLLAAVTLLRVAVMLFWSPPPSVTAVLPLSVTLVRVSVPSFPMPAPAASDVLPLTVTRVSVATPVL
jgi:hypothetical protein